MTNPALQRLATGQLLHAGVGPRTVDHWIKTGRLIVLHRAVNDARLADLPPRLHHNQPTRSAATVSPQPEIKTIVARLVAELDGADYHDAFETDRAEDAALVAAGLRVVRLTWDRLTHQPRREAARFRCLLAQTRQSARSRPA